MANRERLLAVGARRGERLMRELMGEVRDARVQRGLTIADVAAGLGVARSTLGRWELCRGPYPNLVQSASLCQLLGLDLSLKVYPTGSGLRDAAHAELLRRFRNETPLISWTAEYVMPIGGDLRAWDLFATIEAVRVGVAGETRLHDSQDLLRREHRKMRDSGVDRLLLVVWSTHANRALLRDVRETLRADLPLDTRPIMAALRAGKAPSDSGIVLI